VVVEFCTGVPGLLVVVVVCCWLNSSIILFHLQNSPCTPILIAYNPPTLLPRCTWMVFFCEDVPDSIIPWLDILSPLICILRAVN
jgi:hypothetical protein